MAVDAFLKIDGVDGESKDKIHKGEIEVLSFSWGITVSGSFRSGSGGGEGKASFHDFHFGSKTTKASPKLAQGCATGVHYKEAVITVRKAGSSTDFYKATMSDVIISSIEEGASEGAEDDSPMDQVSLNFVKMDIDYRIVGSGGTILREVEVEIALPPVDPAGG